MTNTSTLGSRGFRPVLVGVDGSVSAQGALAWAAAAAASRRCPLRIIHTFMLPLLGSAPDMTAVGDLTLRMRSAAEWTLTEAETYARDIAPKIRITRELFIAGAAPTLLSQAQDAELLVVGSRGIGGFRGLLVGSVSAAVAAHAPCPVVVVHPHRSGTAFSSFPTGRVVVGVDGSEVSAAAIRFAYHEAVRRHIGVTAVHAVPQSRQHPQLSVPAHIAEQVEQQLFAAAMECKEGLLSGMDVDLKVVRAHPAQALINESEAAELVVVGSHGHGGFTGMFLGSVSQAALQHAACPVAVVRPHWTGSTRSRSTTRPSLQITTASRHTELKELP
ncbi:universal stress protein [Kribbella sp. NPDC003557]|uniref:universal stress protein n=1 Tax=Kribbella sp. NPDC003557 TaxID=3154449 RepID=UPI0033B96200